MSLSKTVKAIQKLYPIKYSETAWDNTGLLLDSSLTSASKNDTKILLTIDLTKKVVDEAISNKTQLIIAYHPFIFKGIKKIEPLVNPQHDSLIRLISNGISVYSPHTSVDAVKGGVNDWLIEGITTKENLARVQVINPHKEDQEIGVGRVVELHKGVSIDELITKLKQHLGIKNMMIARGGDDNQEIKTIAICAGSGGSVFANVEEDIDVYLTGELSHHEVLSLKEQGKTVLVTNHSNTERGYLSRMKQLLQLELPDQEIVISKEDADPYDFI